MDLGRGSKIRLMTRPTGTRFVCTGLAFGLFLCACERETNTPAGSNPSAGFGTANAEQVFQQAEVLRHSLDHAGMEQRRPRALEIGTHDERRDSP